MHSRISRKLRRKNIRGTFGFKNRQEIGNSIRGNFGFKNRSELKINIRGIGEFKDRQKNGKQH